MRIRANSCLVLLCAIVLAVMAAAAQKQSLASRILSAKSVYFRNATGSEPVGQSALAALKKWGKYQIVADPTQADLILLLSADPYKGGNIIFANGQTGRVDNSGTVTKDPHPNFNKLAPTRYAYLTVIDVKTGYALWTDSRVWGGLLTGFNSAGARASSESLKNKLKSSQANCAASSFALPRRNSLTSPRNFQLSSGIHAIFTAPHSPAYTVNEAPSFS